MKKTNVVIKRINELRRKKGWSQYELAKVTGISKNAVYAWNRNGAVPSLCNIQLICDAMDITIEQFFCGTGSYNLSEDERRLIQDWFVLTDLEKEAIFGIIEVFKTLKS